MLWKGNIPQVPTRRTFSSHTPQRQSQQKSVQDKFHWMSTLFSQIFLIYILQHGLFSIHQTYTCKSRIIFNIWHYILVCSLHGLSPRSWSTSDSKKMMEYTGSSLQTADGLQPVDLQCCGKGIYLKYPQGEHSAPIRHKDRASRNLYKTNSTGCQHCSHKYFNTCIFTKT